MIFKVNFEDSMKGYWHILMKKKGYRIDTEQPQPALSTLVIKMIISLFAPFCRSMQ